MYCVINMVQPYLVPLVEYNYATQTCNEVFCCAVSLPFIPFLLTPSFYPIPSLCFFVFLHIFLFFYPFFLPFSSPVHSSK